MAGSGAFQQDAAKPIEKGLPILIVPEDHPSLGFGIGLRLTFKIGVGEVKETPHLLKGK
jgi:hypothetical protein